MSDALPVEWVHRIFAKLAVRYGQSFLRRWDGLDIKAVHADWAEQLARFQSQPDCIKYALDNLPADKPPTVSEFRAICNSAPEPNTPRLEAPKSAPPAEVVQAIKAIGNPTDPKAWAHGLKAREMAGEKLLAVQRSFWRVALGEQ